MSEGGTGGMVAAAVGGAIQMGVDAHVRGQNWSRQKNVLQKAVRWRVRDLRAAGLNPILAANMGFGTGGAPSLTGPSGNLGATAAAGLAAGASASTKKSEIAKNIALTESATAAAFKANAEGVNAENYLAVIQSQSQKMAADARGAAAAALQLEYDLPRAQAISDMWTNPVTRPAMQLKHGLQGTPLMRWNPNPGRSYSPNEKYEGQRPGRVPHPRGPLIKGRK